MSKVMMWHMARRTEALDAVQTAIEGLSVAMLQAGTLTARLKAEVRAEKPDITIPQSLTSEICFQTVVEELQRLVAAGGPVSRGSFQAAMAGDQKPALLAMADTDHSYILKQLTKPESERWSREVPTVAFPWNPKSEYEPLKGE